jgi:hypothetical protein
METTIKDELGRKFKADFTFTIRTNGYKSWRITLQLNSLTNDVHGKSEYKQKEFEVFYNNEEWILLLSTMHPNLKDENIWGSSELQPKFEDEILLFIHEEFPRFVLLDDNDESYLCACHFWSEVADNMEMFYFTTVKIIDTWKR